MVIQVRDETVGGTILYQSDTGTPVPDLFFTNQSFNEDTRGVWVTNESPQREGDFKHYNGSRDTQMDVEIVLTGVDRFDTLADIKATKDDILYLIADDVDSSLNGQYVVTSNIRNVKDPVDNIIRVRMKWERYNN